MNFEDGSPLETSAVSAAHGLRIQIIFNFLDLTSRIRSSPGSQILGIPASLTRAIDFPDLRKLIILGIFM